jgi:hypothetical protein
VFPEQMTDDKIQECIRACRAELVRRGDGDTRSKFKRPLEVRASKMVTAVGHFGVYPTGVILRVRDDRDVTDWVEVTLPEHELAWMEQAVLLTNAKAARGG